MRLWHYKLIPYLPNKLLIAQWRECIAIKRQWEKDTLKHRLVSYITNYDRIVFYIYVFDIYLELQNRNIKCNINLLNEMFMFCSYEPTKTMFHYPEHNNKYLAQCYYNLEEKADRGIITEEEFKKIYRFYKEENKI